MISTIWAALCAPLLMPQLAAAAGSGSFSPTGSMSVAREGAGAAPLPDGRVLVAAGYFYDGSDHFLSSAEAFNPQAGGFSTADIGSMGTARYFAAAAPLLDGRVLVTGGETPPSFAVTNTAEVFNPQTGTFSPVGPMQAARDGHAMALLPDGRVLVVGVGTPNAEVFNPQTNTFSSAGIGQMTTNRIGPIAASLPDGRVLVAGGLGSSGRLSSAEVFDPNTNTFSSAGIGSMTLPRYFAAAARLPDGRVLVAGGQIASNVATASAEVFNPATNSFSSAGIGPMGTARQVPVAAPLPDGRVLVAGGAAHGTTSTYFSSAEIFAATNSFSFRVKGKKLIVSVQASGGVSVSDAKAPLSALASKKKRKLLLKPSTASGDPQTIIVRLRLTKLAKAKLRRQRRLSVRARITFKPQGGLANTRTAKLNIKRKNRTK